MIAAIVVVIYGLWLAAPLLVPFVTACFITVISLPVVRWLTARRVPRWAAILIAVVLDCAVLVGFIGLVGGSLDALRERVPYYQARLSELTLQVLTWVDAHGLSLDSARIERFIDEPDVVDFVAGLVQRLTTLVAKALLVALLVLFMLFESGPWKNKMAYVLHRPTQDLPRFTNATREVQTYLVVKSALSVVTGALCGVWVAICGVDFALLWGLIAFMLNYIPTLGMFIATIPPVLVALIQFGPGSALLVLTGYLVINFTLGNFVEPRIMGRALGLSPVVVFLSMVFWGALWGPIGALLGVPLTMMIKIVLANTEDLRWAAVLLGSTEWFEQRRREWEDPYEAERRRSQVPSPPEILESQETDAVAPPDAPAETLSVPEPNPPLDEEDAFGGSGPRSIEGSAAPEKDRETYRSA